MISREPRKNRKTDLSCEFLEKNFKHTHTQKSPAIKAKLIHTHFFLSDCDETLYEQRNNSLKRTLKSESMIVRLFESELSIQCSTMNEYERMSISFVAIFSIPMFTFFAIQRSICLMLLCVL